MKASNGEVVDAARKVKRHLENHFTEAQNKAENVAAETERQQKIQRTADEKRERLRAMAESRCTAGVEGLAVDHS